MWFITIAKQKNWILLSQELSQTLLTKFFEAELSPENVDHVKNIRTKSYRGGVVANDHQETAERSELPLVLESGKKRFQPPKYI